MDELNRHLQVAKDFKLPESWSVHTEDVYISRIQAIQKIVSNKTRSPIEVYFTTTWDRPHNTHAPTDATGNAGPHPPRYA